MFSRRTAITFLVLCSQLVSSFACPFCLAPPQTFSEQFLLADAVIIAEFVKFEVLNDGTRPLSTFRIRNVLTATPEAMENVRGLEPGGTVQRSSEASGSPGDLFLIYGDVQNIPAIDSSAAGTFTNNSGGTPLPIRSVSQSDSPRRPSIDWTDHTAISLVAADYLKTLPDRSLPVPKRLAWYIEYLESPDPIIAGDAWAEFGCAAYEDVRACRQLYSPERLKSWISDPTMSPERLGLYGLMLGLCGSSEDAGFLHSQCVNAETGEFRFGAEGLVAGYLLLSKESGLTDIERQFLTSEVSSAARHALLQTLDFLHTYEPSLIPRKRIHQSARLLLRDPVLAETTIMSLARWQDWDSLPLIIQLYSEVLKSAPPAENDSLLRSMIQFAQLCSKANSVPSNSTPADTKLPNNGLSQRRLADQFLAEIATNHPELLRPRESPFLSPAPQ